MAHKTVHVNSPHVQYTPEAIVSDYYYDTVQTKVEGDNVTAVHHRTKFVFKTNRNVPKLGYGALFTPWLFPISHSADPISPCSVMVVGLGGNNGTTMVAGVVANREYVFAVFEI